MGKVHVTIDGIQVYVPDTYTVLEAAKEINIHIPTLCFLKDVSEIGCCRMCLVEVKGSRALHAAIRSRTAWRYVPIRRRF